jgi:hypothetical protein
MAGKPGQANGQQVTGCKKKAPRSGLRDAYHEDLGVSTFTQSSHRRTRWHKGNAGGGPEFHAARSFERVLQYTQLELEHFARAAWNCVLYLVAFARASASSAMRQAGATSRPSWMIRRATAS